MDSRIRLLTNWFYGIVLATFTLAVIFASVTIALGSEYFEWGVGPSFLVSWLVCLTGYVVGSLVLVFGAALLRNDKVNSAKSFSLYGVVMVGLMWLSTEVRPIVTFTSGHVTEPVCLALSVVVAAGVVLALGIASSRRVSVSGIDTLRKE